MEGPDPAENATWLAAGRELRAGGFPLPDIHAWDLGAGLFIMEDLGDVRLADLEAGGGAPFEEACLGAARLLADLHDRAWGILAPAAGLLAPRYDAEFMFVREWSYFLQGARLLGMEGGFEERLAPEGRKLAALSGCEREMVFIHRDYQSRNILVACGAVRIVDWQGGRMGPPFYDLASLLYDPYTALSDGARRGILAAYLEARQGSRRADDYDGRTRFFGLVRLMQAAGAYAHLAASRGMTAYARFLPRALGRARELAQDLPGGVFAGTVAFLEEYLARLPRILEGMGVCAP
jgi:aminoglycoside/choline kinase family phosphotransferase